MRLNRGTILLLVASVLVVIVVGVFQQPIVALLSSPTPTQVIQQLLPFDIAQEATQLIVRQGDAFTQIDRVNDRWQISDGTVLDETRETNHDFVTGILRLMSTFEYSRVFDTTDLSPYGLESPTTSVEIATADETYRIQFGTTNPDGDQLYLRFNDRDRVYLVPAVFEFANIMRLATEPPYRDVVVTEDDVPDNLLFPDVFGYQVAEFMIQDQRDGSSITYTQGEQGTWNIDGTVVNTELEVDHIQVAINVSQFLFLEVEPLNTSVMDSLTDRGLLTVSITTDDDSVYQMTVYAIDDAGYVGIFDDGKDQIAYALPVDTINSFFDMIIAPPYMTTS